MLSKFGVNIALAVAVAGTLAGCGKAEPQGSGKNDPGQQAVASIAIPRSAPNPVPAGRTIALPVGDGANSPLVLDAGHSVVGVAIAPVAGKIVAFDVQLGTFANTSTGLLKLELCDAGNCVTGDADLLTSMDNHMFLIVPTESINVAAGDSLRFSLTKEGGKVAVAVWTYPQASSEQQIGIKDGQLLTGRTAKLGLRFSL